MNQMTATTNEARLSDVRGIDELTLEFVDALRRTETAATPMRQGDPVQYLSLWAEGPDVTLYGAWGPIERGIDRLKETFTWVGTRFTGGEAETVYATIWESGDLGATVGFERGIVAVDGGEALPMTIRVTHLYHRENGVWSLVHRHADFPPADSRR